MIGDNFPAIASAMLALRYPGKRVAARPTEPSCDDLLDMIADGLAKTAELTTRVCEEMAAVRSNPANTFGQSPAVLRTASRYDHCGPFYLQDGRLGHWGPDGTLVISGRGIRI